jgi:hypothetical protein
MTNLSRLRARRFQSLVATFLELPADSSDSTIRKGLRRKGPGFVEWYETRLRAIADAQYESRTAGRSLDRTVDSRH